MAEFKLVIGDPKSKKSYQREVKDEAAKAFRGLKIGDKVKGDSFDLPGYEFEITGGSDASGFPMRRDVPGTMKKKILAIKGVGVTNKKKYRKPGKKGLRTMKGMRTRKTVAGNTIFDKTAQINLKVLTSGKDSLGEEAPAAPAEEAKPEEKKEAKVEEAKPAEKPAEEKSKEEAKPEEKKEEPKPEEKKETPKEEAKPAEKPEEKKEEPKAEEKKE